MNREDLSELHYISPIANLVSIMQRGILSNRRAAKLQHQSVAKQEVQDLRAKVRVPGGRALHEYANLYICARNPMLYKGIPTLGLGPLSGDSTQIGGSDEWVDIEDYVRAVKVAASIIVNWCGVEL